jgi:hypothetical protein
MKDSEKRQLVELIQRVARKEVSRALDQHLKDAHKEK